MSKWFSRALHGEPPSRGKHIATESKPRHVVSLSSSVKLPTFLQQTFPTAHKGPINVARYNTTGRYLLTGSSDARSSCGTLVRRTKAEKRSRRTRSTATRCWRWM